MLIINSFSPILGVKHKQKALREFKVTTLKKAIERSASGIAIKHIVFGVPAIIIILYFCFESKGVVLLEKDR